MDIEQCTQKFIATRDALQAMDERHKNERQPLIELRDALEGVIHGFMTANKLENLKTSAGTCYTSTRTTATLSDPDAFMIYVIEHKRFELLERRANSTAVREFVEESKSLPPGCNLNTIQTLGVRRKPGS